MKPGDLRRFKEGSTYTFMGTGTPDLDNRIFLVLKAQEALGVLVPAWVSILIDGSVMEHWSYSWVILHSEAVDEAR